MERAGDLLGLSSTEADCSPVATGSGSGKVGRRSFLVQHRWPPGNEPWSTPTPGWPGPGDRRRAGVTAVGPLVFTVAVAALGSAWLAMRRSDHGAGPAAGPGWVAASWTRGSGRAGLRATPPVGPPDDSGPWWSGAPGAGRRRRFVLPAAWWPSTPAIRLLVVGPDPERFKSTSGLAIPALLEWKGPVVAASVKSRSGRHTVAWRRDQGPGVGARPDRSTEEAGHAGHRCRAAVPWAGARRVADGPGRGGGGGDGTLSDGDFWYATAAKLLAPLLLAAASVGAPWPTWCGGSTSRRTKRWPDALVQPGRGRPSGPRGPPGVATTSAQAVYTTAETVSRPSPTRRGRLVPPRWTPTSTPFGSSRPTTPSTCAPRPTNNGGSGRCSPRWSPGSSRRAYDRAARRAAPRPASARRPRRSGQRRPSGRTRRPGRRGGRSRDPAGHRLAGPGPDHRPLRTAGATVVNTTGPSCSSRASPIRAPWTTPAPWSARPQPVSPPPPSTAGPPPPPPRSAPSVVWPRPTACAGWPPVPACSSRAISPPPPITLRPWYRRRRTPAPVGAKGPGEPAGRPFPHW